MEITKTHPHVGEEEDVEVHYLVEGLGLKITVLLNKLHNL